MVTYVALIRGINVGGHQQIKMEELREAFRALGFGDVGTVLASGNVLFDAPKTGRPTLAAKVREGLREAFGGEMDVIIRTRREVAELVDSEPFRDVLVGPQTRLYVTFLAEEAGSGLTIPYESPEQDFKILSVAGGNVCSVLTLSPTRGTTDLMKFIEREFGRRITTRSWNTVLKTNEKMMARPST
jgi:uncharacterized protein (DUF1697 family)